MPHDVAFHQGLHCLLRNKRSLEKEIQYFFESITCEPSIYTMDHPDRTMELYGIFHWSKKGKDKTMFYSQQV